MPHTSSGAAALIDLDRPLPNALSPIHINMLEALQGNILKAHGKPHAAVVLLQFGEPEPSKQFLASIAYEITNAASQVRQHQRGADTAPASSDAFLTCAISATGYRALGYSDAMLPDDAAFREGAKERGPIRLADPSANNWEGAWKKQVDAALLIASAELATIDGKLAELRPRLAQSGISLLGVERTKLLRNAHGQVIEHFGFVDGISRPNFFNGDAYDATKSPNVTQLHPLKRVLVQDRLAADPLSFGSYLVVRKIEQNVAAFLAFEDALQQSFERASGTNSIAAEFAGATLFGRFRDGTPLVNQCRAGALTNDFTFDSDPLGFKCPFHAHIRKVNPRGETHDANESARVLVRRGMTYGDRQQRDGEMLDQPDTGVGLLFQSFQASIVEQFEHVMKGWIHNVDFPRLDAGADAVVGGTALELSQRPEEKPAQAPRSIHRVGWNDGTAPSVETEWKQFLTFLGGEYFFAPSVSFFKQLASEARS